MPGTGQGREPGHSGNKAMPGEDRELGKSVDQDAAGPGTNSGTETIPGTGAKSGPGARAVQGVTSSKKLIRHGAGNVL